MKVLFIQFGNEMYPQQELNISSQYWETFYSSDTAKNLGYARLEHAFEIPKWIAEVSYLVPNYSKELFWCVDNVQSAIRKICEYRPDFVLMSLMDPNKWFIRDIIASGELYSTRFIIGGYNKEFVLELTKINPKIRYVDTVKETAEALEVPYVRGTDYSMFEGLYTIPRLTLSSGCRNHCKFCIISHGAVIPETEETVVEQLESFNHLRFKLVYIDDKTFGQSSNWTSLDFIYEHLKRNHPEFEGFIVQTTPHEIKKNIAKFAKLHVKVIEIGLETANNEILRTYSKPTTVEVVEEATELAVKNNINVIYNIVVGFPEETKQTYENTQKFLQRHLGNDVIAINPAIYTDYSNPNSLGELEFDESQENVEISKQAWEKFLKLSMSNL